MTYILSVWEKSSIKGKQLIFYGIRKYLDVSYIIGHLITKVRRIDLVGEVDIDLCPAKIIIILCFLSRMKLWTDTWTCICTCAKFWNHINLLTKICWQNAGTIMEVFWSDIIEVRLVNLLEKQSRLTKYFFSFPNIKFKFLICKCHSNIVSFYQETSLFKTFINLLRVGYGDRKKEYKTHYLFF